MTEAIARMEQLLATGCYRLVAVEEVREDRLILGQLHKSAFSRLEYLGAARANEYESVLVELKTAEDVLWARDRLAEAAAEVNLELTEAVKRLDELLATGCYVISEVLESPLATESGTIARWLALAEPICEHVDDRYETVVVELYTPEELQWVAELLART